jgi:hypothetical protein
LQPAHQELRERSESAGRFTCLNQVPRCCLFQSNAAIAGIFGELRIEDATEQ